MNRKLVGSFDRFVAVMFQPAWDIGAMAHNNILEIVEVLRRCETDGKGDHAHAS
jgi:hypothetical protein